MATQTQKLEKEKLLAESKRAMRSFRANADIENFYRFVYDNGLRREAEMILASIVARVGKKKKRRPRGTKIQ